MHKEIHDLYTSPNIIRIVKSRITCCACRVHLRFLFENPKETIPLGKRRHVEGRIILKLMLTKLDGEGIGWADLVQDAGNFLTLVTIAARSFMTS
jgi:hypothetical protein